MADSSYQFIDHGNHQTIVLSSVLNDVPWNKIDGVGMDLSQRVQSLSKPRVIMDISALDYMGSAMVALVVRVWKVIDAQQGKMVVVNQHEMVHQVLDLAGLTSKWEIVDSHPDALNRLGVTKPKPAEPSSGGGSVAGLILKTLVVLLAIVGVAAIVYVAMNGVPQ